MERLLRWGIENTPTNDASSGDAPSRGAPLDPGIIDAILGKPDAVQMQEDLGVALDSNRSEEERVNALDHLEMLVEQIDNANDLARLGLWPKLQSLFVAEDTPRSVILHTLWVIGTALQNNPAAQDAYLSLPSNPLPTLLSFFSTPSTKSDIKIRSKVIYALSGLLKHNAPALTMLSDPQIKGWNVLREAIKDPDIQTRRKTVFLLNTLLLPSSSGEEEEEQHGQTATTATGASLHTPNQQQHQQQDSSAPPTSVVHPNSHAAVASSPSRANTSVVARKAFQEHGMLTHLIDGLVDPVPYGEDGEFDQLDEQFEETAIRVIHTFTILCGQTMEEQDRQKLASWINRKYPSLTSQVPEGWVMTQAEVEEFMKAVSVA